MGKSIQSRNTCDKCRYLISRFRLCTNPEFRNKPTLLIPYRHTFLRRKGCHKVTTSGKNKYQAKKVVVGKECYDSRAEYKRALQLELLQKAGVISNLQHHEKIVLIPKSKYGREIYYEADFSYTDNKTKEKIIEDVKSKPTVTKIYRLKKRMIQEQYGITIREIY